jgi:hypothetical protein
LVRSLFSVRPVMTGMTPPPAALYGAAKFGRCCRRQSVLKRSDMQWPSGPYQPETASALLPCKDHLAEKRGIDPRDLLVLGRRGDIDADARQHLLHLEAGRAYVLN